MRLIRNETMTKYGEAGYYGHHRAICLQLRFMPGVRRAVIVGEIMDNARWRLPARPRVKP